MRYSIIAAAFLLVLPVTVSGEESVGARQYVVGVALKEKPNARPRQPGKILAEPKVVVLEGRQTDMCVGGEIAVGETNVPFGMSLAAKVTRANDTKKVRVAGVLDVSSIDREPADDDVVSRESYSVHFDKIVELGATIKVRVSKSADRERWFELSVESAQGLQPIRVSSQPAVTAVPATGGTLFTIPD